MLAQHAPSGCKLFCFHPPFSLCQLTGDPRSRRGLGFILHRRPPHASTSASHNAAQRRRHDRGQARQRKRGRLRHAN